MLRYIIASLLLLPALSLLALEPTFQYDPSHVILSDSFQASMDSLSHSTLTRGNRFELLIDSEASLRKRLELARSAQKSILIQTMIFRKGRSQILRDLVDVLIQKVADDVSVHLIIDDLSSYLDPALMAQLERAGVLIAYLNPTFQLDPLPAHVRTHEKYFIVDTKHAVLGGQNLSDHSDPALPITALVWHDTDVYVHGPIAEELTKRFMTVWSLTTGLPAPPPLVQLDWPTPESDTARRAHISEARVIYNEIYTGPKYINATYLALIEQAQDLIIWTGNHLWVTDEFEWALKSAANRGVDVVLMTNSFKTSWYFPFYYQYHYLNGYLPFLRSNVHLRLTNRQYNHSKIFYVDGVVASVGSLNHDLFSLKTDSEGTLISYDLTFNRKVFDQLQIFLSDTFRPFLGAR